MQVKQARFKDHPAEQVHREKLHREVPIGHAEEIAQAVARAVNVTIVPTAVNRLHQRVGLQEVPIIHHAVITNLQQERILHHHLHQHHQHRHRHRLHHQGTVIRAAEAAIATQVHAAVVTEAADR